MEKTKIQKIDVNKLRNGDILLCRRDTFLSRIIKRNSRGDWSHVALIINIYNRKFIIDSQ